MTQKEKQLLLKDLCARLPYGIIINTGDEDLKLDRQHQGIGVLYPEDCSDEFNKRNNNASFYITISGCYYGEEIKPYLRPLSSMTEKEIEKYKCLNDALDENYEVHIDNAYSAFDWLNANHFDYRGLISKGLALEAPKDMYNLNENKL